jgi:hypothetical protein
MDAYVQHLHNRIAVLNDELNDCLQQLRGNPVREPSDDYQNKVRRAFAEATAMPATVQSSSPSPRQPQADAEIHDSFWEREDHLESLADESFLGHLRESEDDPFGTGGKRRRRFTRHTR